MYISRLVPARRITEDTYQIKNIIGEVSTKKNTGTYTHHRPVRGSGVACRKIRPVQIQGRSKSDHPYQPLFKKSNNKGTSMDSMKTFDALLNSRVIQGYLFVNEHFLANRLSSVDKEKQYHLPPHIDRDQLFEELTTIMSSLGYLIEADVKIMASNAFNLLQSPQKYTYCNKLVSLSIDDRVVTVRELSATGAPDVMALHDKLEQVAVTKPIRITSVNGFIDTGVRTMPHNLTVEPEPHLDLLYPNLDVGVSAIFDNFMHSTSNAMLFIGKPGTGKSTLLRHLIKQFDSGYRILTIQDEQLFEHPEMSPYLARVKEHTLIVIEDADTLLRKRKDGNLLMANLLNQLDGIVQRDVKFVFSTNLPSTRDVEPALLRSGRLFKTLEFDSLTKEQVQAIAAVKDIPCPDKEDVVLAELFGDAEKQSSGIGFV